MMLISRIIKLFAVIVCMHASLLYAQESALTQPKPVPGLPNTCRGAQGVSMFLYEIAKYLSVNRNIKMQVEEIGYSQKGTPIMMVTITGAGISEPGRGGLMIVARQHGNEPAGTRAALELIRSFALDDTAELGNLTLRIIPVANPDGMDMFRRSTSNRKDMNRDWSSRKLPETQAIVQAIKTAQPEVLMDLHELTPGSNEKEYIFEVPRTRAAALLNTVKNAFIESEMHIHISAAEHCTTTRLLHRYFAETYHRAAFLVESKYTKDPTENLKARSEYHLRAVKAVLENIVSSSGK